MACPTIVYDSKMEYIPMDMGSIVYDIPTHLTSPHLILSTPHAPAY